MDENPKCCWNMILWKFNVGYKQQNNYKSWLPFSDAKTGNAAGTSQIISRQWIAPFSWAILLPLCVTQTPLTPVWSFFRQYLSWLTIKFDEIYLKITKLFQRETWLRLKMEPAKTASLDACVMCDLRIDRFWWKKQCCQLSWKFLNYKFLKKYATKSGISDFYFKYQNHILAFI